MNNLQYIVKDNTRFAQHMAVELCEQGDFDSVSEAFRWLMQEREAADTIENLQDRLQAVGEMAERVSHTVVATSMALTNEECGECSEAGDYDALREEGESDEHVR